jgi:hypothetical protein
MERCQMSQSISTRVLGGEEEVQVEAFQEEVVVERLCSKSKVSISSLGPCIELWQCPCHENERLWQCPFFETEWKRCRPHDIVCTHWSESESPS